MTYPSYHPLLEVYRGNVIESLIYGAIAICDAQGRLRYHFGNPQTVTYLRSSAKPFQVLPFVERGGMEAFELSDRELAVMCASHSGTDEHVRVIRGIQARVGIREDELLCGVHPAMDKATEKEMQKRGEEPTPIRHNCSGKHTGMLAHAVLRGYSHENYIDIHHPVQQIILQTFSELCGVPVEQIELGIDGCSAPVFAISLERAAQTFALLADPSALPEPRRSSLQRIFRSMAANGDMVAGPGRFDTLLMQTAGGKIACKAGAEGYQGIAILPGALYPNSPALGVTYKISDGDQDGRARPIVGMEILRQLKALSAEQLASLVEFDARPQYNWRKVEVGRYQPAFQLEAD